MNKLINIISFSQFWYWFIGVFLGVFIFETFLLGLWAIPIVNYSISYMAEISKFDLIFIFVFALVFGFGTALFVLARKFSVASCTLGTSSGLLGFFTMLCPICPIFFLSYFGISASVLVLAPYFWWLRLVALILLLIGVIILWRRAGEIKNSGKFDGHSFFQKLAIVLIVVLFLSNQALAIQIGSNILGSPSNQVAISGDFARDVAALVTPTSLPFYGLELGLDFSNLNNINTSIRSLGVMAPMQGRNPIQLTPEEMQRYVSIGTEPTITCEFCCGVKTLVRRDGSPTCGCAHSIAMRGTAAYLLRNYPEMSNAEISYELMRQKGLYFPKQMQKRMAQELAGDASKFTPDIRYLTQNLSPDELAKLQAQAKTSGFKPDAKLDMVGGC